MWAIPLIHAVTPTIKDFFVSDLLVFLASAFFLAAAALSSASFLASASSKRSITSLGVLAPLSFSTKPGLINKPDNLAKASR